MGVLWREDLIRLQREDGSWGRFHSLARPVGRGPITTEQALRRAMVLGMDRNDEPVARAVAYMKRVLGKEAAPPDRGEGTLNWDHFEAMMMAAWIKLLEPEDEQAREVAGFWARIIEDAVVEGHFDEGRYAQVYRNYVPKLAAYERPIGTAQFYMVNLLQGVLSPVAERAYFEHVLNNETGIYYIYGSRISRLPEAFATLTASQYLAALEMLAGYACAKEKLGFAVEWINENQLPDGSWDLGAKAKDGIYLPIHGDWRTGERRRYDCTTRVERVLAKLV